MGIKPVSGLLPCADGLNIDHLNRGLVIRFFPLTTENRSRRQLIRHDEAELGGEETGIKRGEVQKKERERKNKEQKEGCSREKHEKKQKQTKQNKTKKYRTPNKSTMYKFTAGPGADGAAKHWQHFFILFHYQGEETIMSGKKEIVSTDASLLRGFLEIHVT